MAKKCPPGVFCIDNMTLFFLLIVFLCSLYFLFRDSFYKDTKPTVIHMNLPQQEQSSISSMFSSLGLSIPTMNSSGYQIHNSPPQKRVGGIPINVSTSHLDTKYQQVGILTRNNNDSPTPTESGMILALFGRPVHTNRNRWQYYTMTDRTNTIRLPVSKGGRSCSSTNGCDEIFNGDNVYVEGYNDVFVATIYENELPRYIPYI